MIEILFSCGNFRGIASAQGTASGEGGSAVLCETLQLAFSSGEFTKTQTQKLRPCSVRGNSLYLSSKSWCIKPNHGKHNCDVGNVTHVAWPEWVPCGWSTQETKLEPRACLAVIDSELGELDVVNFYRSPPKIHPWQNDWGSAKSWDSL